MDEAAFEERIRKVMHQMRSAPGDRPSVPAMPVPDPACNGAPSVDGVAHAREAMQRFNIILDLAMHRH